MTPDENGHMLKLDISKKNTVVVGAGLGFGKSIGVQRFFRTLAHGTSHMLSFFRQHRPTKHVILSITSRKVQTEDGAARFKKDYSDRIAEFRNPTLRRIKHVFTKYDINKWIANSSTSESEKRATYMDFINTVGGNDSMVIALTGETLH